MSIEKENLKMQSNCISSKRMTTIQTKKIKSVRKKNVLYIRHTGRKTLFYINL